MTGQKSFLIDKRQGAYTDKYGTANKHTYTDIIHICIATTVNY